MTNHRCIDGNLDGSNYASPIPFIGLYIAAASLVCMLMMLYDTVSGVRAQKRWLPCKAFTLNSVTLTLLSIATKIPVDLTTMMPSTMDQLSKLSGTGLVCISVGFLFPSFGVLSQSESFSNIVSLSIFIITIIVNISIQLSTGVIILFFVEHVIILCCMFVLLLMSWIFYGLIYKVPRYKSLTIYESSFCIWLENRYSISFSDNPQIIACTEQTYVAAAIICLLTSIILIQAAVRSLVFNQFPLCSGLSDYGWSVSVIVITQISLVAVGMFAICSRLVAFAKILQFYDLTNSVLDNDLDKSIKYNPILGTRQGFYGYSIILKRFSLKILAMVRSFIILLPRLMFFSRQRNLGQGLDEWRKRKATEDCKIWRRTSKKEWPTPLFRLLSKTYPPQQFSFKISIDSNYESDLVSVNSLTVVLLLRIAQVSLPDHLSRILLKAFIEVKEILHYIDIYIRPEDEERSQEMLVYARAVWEGAELSCLLSDRGFNVHDKSGIASPVDLRVAIHIIEKLQDTMDFEDYQDGVTCRITQLAHTILQGNYTNGTNMRYSSIEDLGSYIQHMFVEMLRMILAQLPIVICKHISNSPPVECEDRIKLAFQHLYKVEPVEDQIEWEWPEDSMFSFLFCYDESDENVATE